MYLKVNKANHTEKRSTSQLTGMPFSSVNLVKRGAFAEELSFGKTFQQFDLPVFLNFNRRHRITIQSEA